MLDHYGFFLDTDKAPQDLDIVIMEIGFSHNQPNYSYGYLRREYYILHYIIDGCGTYTINNKTYELKENDGFVVFPDTTVIYRADREHPWTVYWIGFYGKKSEYFLSRINISASNPIFRFENKSILTDCMEKLYSEIQNTTISFELLLGYFYQIIGNIHKSTAKEQTLYQPVYYFHSLLQFINRNRHLPLRVQDLADHLMLSSSQVYRITKKNCGLSPHELIDQIKMQKAGEMLKTTNISIQEISLLLGYEYVSHFFLVFKKVFHMTPGEYRSQNTLTNKNTISE